MTDFKFPDTFFQLPSATISPPCSPAPHPMSIRWSDDFIVSSSCSTTKTVLPKSLNLSKVSINFLLSDWCNPIEGSSNTYRTPVRPDPICVASLILCASPPDKVAAPLLSCK